MFTGIVEQVGIVQSIKNQGDRIAFELEASFVGRDPKLGESIAVNGCCLTIARIDDRKYPIGFGFDLLQETWQRTNFKCLTTGSKVNLEQALAVGSRLGGHMVSGHVDGTGVIARWEQVGGDYLLEVSTPPELMKFLVLKGSICVEGISLTLASVEPTFFRVYIIPHTRNVTNLGERKVGDLVNLEVDLIGKFVHSFLRPYLPVKHVSTTSSSLGLV